MYIGVGPELFTEQYEWIIQDR